MAMLTHILKDIHQVLYRNRDPHAIPSMDGPLTPNSRLDACQPIGEPIPEADDVVEGLDHVLYVSSGSQVLRLAGTDYTKRSIHASFEGKAGGLALHPDGRLLVCVSGRGLAAVDPTGRQTWLNVVEGQPLRCPTSVTAASDGTIFVSEGSSRHLPEGWCWDLMEKNQHGRIITCGPGLDSADVLLNGLHYPHGVACSSDGKELWFTESWNHHVSRIAMTAGANANAPEPVIHNLPGYPARLGKAKGRNLWLSVFALRNPLVEFLLREDDFRGAMMRTLPPDQWIAPALKTTGSFLEPMQMGNARKLGIQKPWAPARSYGLLIRINEKGEAMESLQSRVGGRYHGITSACETTRGLVIVSKGHDRLLLSTQEAFV